MYRPLLSLVVAFIGYSFLNISQAGQKIGLGVFRTRRAAGLSIWAAATLGTAAAAFINLYAVSLGSVALVGAMAGSGLASLALFSWLVMKEPISRRELLGVAIIFSAAVCIGAFAEPLDSRGAGLGLLYTFLGAACLVYTVLWTVFRRRSLLLAPIIGGFSGAIGGFVALFQKLSTTEQGRARSLARGLGNVNEQSGPFIEILSNPFTLAWIGAAVVSMVVLQFAYRRGKAIQIIPWFSANYVVIPIIGGMAVFGESLLIIQWLGVGLMVTGVIVLTSKLSAETGTM